MYRCEQNLQKSTLFFILFVSTILVTRLSVFLIPELDVTFGGIIIHHFWFGAILLLGALFIPKNNSIKMLLYAVGSGLFADQLVFMLLGAGNDKEYWSLPSLLGTVVITGLIFFTRKRSIQFLLYQ